MRDIGAGDDSVKTPALQLDNLYLEKNHTVQEEPQKTGSKNDSSGKEKEKAGDAKNSGAKEKEAPRHVNSVRRCFPHA